MWPAIQYVTSGITLLAFALAVGAWIYRARLVHRQAVLEELPEADRAEAVDSELEFFRVKTEGLTRKDRFEIAMAQIRARERRFYTIAIVVTIIAVLLTGVSVYSIAASTTRSVPRAAQAFDVRASVLGRRLTQNTTSEPFSKPGSSIDVGCEESKSTSVSYDIPASASVTAHNARWDDQDKIKSSEAHSKLTGGTVVASGSITGLDKHVFNCPGGGHATLVVFGTVNRTTESSEASQPVSIGSSELARDSITFNAPSDANLRIETFRVEIRPRGQNTAFIAVDVPAADGPGAARQIEQTQFGARFRFNAAARTLTISATND